MIIDYYFSAPQGRIPVTKEDLEKPFLLSPTQEHPFLTLGNYFDSLKDFVIQNGESVLSGIVAQEINRKVHVFDEVESCTINSEKHGALYHIASLEFQLDNLPFKLAITTALTEQGKKSLKGEYALLKELTDNRSPNYISKPYLLEEEVHEYGKMREEFFIMLGEWFEDYHEWHFSDQDDQSRICLWDYLKGNRLLSDEDGFSIMRQCAHTLTYYFDLESFRQIHPWHHAAGDFIVHHRNGVIDVKLITVRGYDRLLDIGEPSEENSITALLCFLLDLAVRMRLDKINGTDDVFWAPEYAVKAAVEGFFEGLTEKHYEEQITHEKITGFLDILKSFTNEELLQMYQPLLALYNEGDSNDFNIILDNLENHIIQLQNYIQKYSLKSLGEASSPNMG